MPMQKAEKKELSPRARKLIFAALSIGLCIFVGAMIFFGRQDSAPEQQAPPQPNEAPSQVPDSTEDPENPEGTDEKGNDGDFLTSEKEVTGGDSEGVLNNVSKEKQLSSQDEIYTAVQTAESGMWELLNYDDSTDAKAREDSLKAFFAPGTPVDLKLPSKKTRLAEDGNIPIERHAYFDGKNGQGGTPSDYRVELTGTKEEVMKLPKDGIVSKKNTSGMDAIKKQDVRWIVSMKQVQKKGEKGKSWVIWNYSESPN